MSLHGGFSLTGINAGGALGIDTDTTIISVRDELRLRFNKSIKMRAGLDLRVNRAVLKLKLPSNVPREGDQPGQNSGGDILDDVTESRVNRWAAEPALYLEFDVNPIKSIRLQVGIRGDYNSVMNNFSFDPRGTVVWSPVKALELKASVGLFSQPPQGQEISEDFGNPDLLHEKAIHYIVGGTYNWTKYFSTRLTFYYKDLFDLISRSDKQIERNGEKVPERYHNVGRGSSYGLEVMIRHQPHKRFFGWLSYTLGRSMRQDKPEDDERFFQFDQTHILTVLGAYKLGYGFTISARFRLVSGNPTTPRIGSIYNADGANYIPLSGEVYSERNPLFNQLDIRLDYQLTFDTWKLLFYLDVQNVYNYPNQEGVQYNYDSSKSAPLTGVPVFPSIGIKGEF